MLRIPARSLRSLVSFLVGSCLLPTFAAAGKFSAIRSEVRHKSHHHSHDDSHDEDTPTHHTPPAKPGRLNAVRRETRTRKHRRHHHHVDSHGHHSHGHHSHGYRGYSPLPLIVLDVERTDNWCPPTIVPSGTVPPAPAIEPIPIAGPRFQPQDVVGTREVDDWTDSSTVRLRAENGFRHDGVKRLGFGLLICESQGLGLQTDWDFYTEDLLDGTSDELRVGDFNVVYEIFGSELVRWRVGLGLAWLDDATETNFGMTFTLGADLFPGQIFTVTGKIDIGNIGEAEMFHGRIAASATWKHVEIFAGYDYRSFGPVSLHGPMAGVGIRF